MITADIIIEKLQSFAAKDAPPRGDHDLNPGMQTGKDLTPAAVLVPLVIRGGGLTTLFTQRTEHLLHHAGQISFPGGHVDPGDDSPEDTALRETEEEVGLARAHITTIGRLNQYVTRTGFAITPVVALVSPPFDVTPDADEVDEVFEVPLDFLLDPANHQRHRREFKGQIREFYAMPYEDYYIWGATAGMLVNLYEVLRD
ncbi:MAG: CoA pyrophosphatase [Proteobacteria bacterium]|nr:CoA pyrophosphatase [Pseudomonadota bacterium]MDA1022958.1 CoA pyrophosphatase [Pseudomonadota bacterium]